jgi:antirestriction protein ArdC
MFLAGTEDARGFKQWQEAGRRVKKGAKAFYILGPVSGKKKIKERVIDPETGEEKEVESERVFIKGFRCIPVFRYEDTEGEPLDMDCDPPEPPPLYDVAQKFVENIKYQPYMGSYLGYFRPGKKEIVLKSHDVKVFFHELAHAVHHQIKPGGLKGGQHADQEIVAETVAAALCEMYGYSGYIWSGWQYIKEYAGRDERKALKAVMSVLADVEKVLEVILETDASENRGCAA